MLFLAEEPPVDIQPVLVDQGLLRARGDPGGGGHGGHSDHGGGQPWPRGDTKEGDKPWVGGDFGEPSTWSEGTPPSGSATAPHLGPHLVRLIQILLLI